MIDKDNQKSLESQKEQVRHRIHTKIDPQNYTFFPAKKQVDYYDDETQQRVAVYVRVSTGNILQTTSYELQKKYYEAFVQHHPNWVLTKIYADEGISGTSLTHREAFQQMISNCKAGKIDMIITKSVSRFARNVVDCISVVRMLAELPCPVGVFFESECIFSLKDDSQMALSFQATMAQEESHTRSRSMETSLRMRLDGGLPLTPKLLGYSHDADGNLVVNPEEEPTVRLIFYMYLYGYSTAQIADALTTLGRKTYLGNVTWSSSTVIQVLRNERHCGDVLTRKTFTPNYLNHKAKKNRGDRPQSLYRNHHPGIISRDDFIAVQHLLNNAKYGNTSILPELRVIDSGLLRGFVIVHPRWAGFQPKDYMQAAASIFMVAEAPPTEPTESLSISVEAGDFDMRGFEIARSELFENAQRPWITFQQKKLKLSTTCVRTFGKSNQIELLIDPIQMRFAVRTAPKGSRNAVICSRISEGQAFPKEIPGAAFLETLFQIFQWNSALKYRIVGEQYQQEGETAYIFQISDAEAFIQPAMLNQSVCPPEEVIPLSKSGKRVRAIPENWMHSFGTQYYLHKHIFPPIEMQSEEDWKIRMEGQLFETREKLKVTGFEELKTYIYQELGGIPNEQS